MSRQTRIRLLAASAQRRWYRSPAALVAALAACLAVACMGGGSDEANAPTGSLSMQLATEVNGTTYRLSGARFDVFGPVDASFDSDDDPDLTAITATLPRGDYSILLRDGWRLLRQSSPEAGFEPVEAALTSDNPRLFSINEGETTRVAYVFETNGVVVDLGDGFLEVAIEVVETGAGASGGTGGIGGTGGAGGTGGSGTGGVGGGPAVDREAIASAVCQSLDAVPDCPEVPDCVAAQLEAFAFFDSVGCSEPIDALFECIANAPASSFECSVGAPSFIIGGVCSEEENVLFSCG